MHLKYRFALKTSPLDVISEEKDTIKSKNVCKFQKS